MLDHLPKLPSAFAEGQVAWMYEQPTSESLPVLQKEGTLLELRRVTFFHGNDFHLLGTLSMFPKYPRRKNA